LVELIFIVYDGHSLLKDWIYKLAEFAVRQFTEGYQPLNFYGGFE
jgi:hypothetical protein